MQSRCGPDAGDSAAAIPFLPRTPAHPRAAPGGTFQSSHPGLRAARRGGFLIPVPSRVISHTAVSRLPHRPREHSTRGCKNKKHGGYGRGPPTPHSLCGGCRGSRPPALFPPSAAAHREGDIPDAAHRVAVVSRVHRPGEDLMQMHPPEPGMDRAMRERGAEPRARPCSVSSAASSSSSGRASRFPGRLPRDPPRRGRGSGLTPRPLLAFLPPPPCHGSSATAARGRSAAEMPGCSHCLPHRRTDAGGGQGCV